MEPKKTSHLNQRQKIHFEVDRRKAPHRNQYSMLTHQFLGYHYLCNNLDYQPQQHLPNLIRDCRQD